MSAPPVIRLFPYQLAWIEDQSQFKIINKSRQIGFTWVEMLDIVERLIARPRSKWFYLSISEDRAAEAVDYAIMHALAMGCALTAKALETSFFESTEYKQLTLRLPNGSELVGLPANPRTARGVSGNLTLDEFAHQIHARQIWQAAIPAAVTWGWRVRVISTPNGQQGEYYRVWTNDGAVNPDSLEAALRDGGDPCGDGWSRHLIDIHTAKQQGHPVDVHACRDIAGDSETFAQEYECRFLDEALAWMPYALLESCTNREASLVFDPATHQGGPLFAGYDVGRARDLACLWIVERRGDVAVTRMVETLERKPFREQRQVLDCYMPHVAKLAIDAQGIGAQLAEEMQTDWGESLVMPIKPTGQIPAKMATRIRSQCERNLFWLPDCRAIRDDFHSVRRKYTANGNVSFQAPHRKDGHADRFWAAGLALEAAEQLPDYSYESLGSASRWESDRIGGRGWREVGY